MISEWRAIIYYYYYYCTQSFWKSMFYMSSIDLPSFNYTSHCPKDPLCHTRMRLEPSSSISRPVKCSRLAMLLILLWSKKSFFTRVNFSKPSTFLRILKDTSSCLWISQKKMYSLELIVFEIWVLCTITSATWIFKHLSNHLILVCINGISHKGLLPTLDGISICVNNRDKAYSFLQTYSSSVRWSRFSNFRIWLS